MPKFKITTWARHEIIIEAESLEEAVEKANRKNKKWESVQYINPEESETSRRTEGYRINEN